MHHGLKVTLLATSCIALFSAPQPVPAQQAAQPETDKPSGMLEEIVVTAQRREQQIQDVGVAITAISRETLALTGTRSSIDIAQLTPSVSVSGAVAGQTLQYSIRGVTQADYFDAIEPPVAVYVDDIYIPSMQGQSVALFDVQRVEVLKGPQGTLFGRNATGGLVHTITTRPNTAKLEGFGEVTYATDNQATIEGAINLPLGESTAIRVSGFYDRLDDYIDNVGAARVHPDVTLNFGSPGVGLSDPGPDVGGYENKSGRIQLLFEPSDQLSIRLAGTYSDVQLSGGPWFPAPTMPVLDQYGRIVDTVRVGSNDTRLGVTTGGATVTQPPGFIFASPSANPNSEWFGRRIYPGGTWYGLPRLNADDSVVAVDYAPDNSRETTLVGAYIDYDFSTGLHLASVTGYQETEGKFQIDVDAHPVNMFVYGSNGDVKPFSQEFRLSGETEGFRWVTGLYYLHNTADVVNGVSAPKGSLVALLFNGAFPGVTTDTGIDFPTISSLKTDSTSVFGQIEWDFTPTMTLVAGARYVNEQQEFDYKSIYAVNDNDYNIDHKHMLGDGPALPTYHDDRTQQLWAGKLQLEYRPSDPWLLYAGINRGVKAGSYNAPINDLTGAVLPQDRFAYEPEVLWNYEGGFKYTGDRWLFNANAFYYDYQDYQVFLYVQLIGSTLNADSEIYGFEAETSVLLTDSLTFNLGYSYNHTEIKDFVTVPAIEGVAPAVVRDVEHTFSPENQLQANLTYRSAREYGGGRFTLFAQGAYTSSQYHGIRNFSSNLLPSFWIANFAASWERASGLSLTAFINNAFDERYPVTGFDNTTVAGNNEEVYGRPVSYGLKLGYRF